MSRPDGEWNRAVVSGFRTTSPGRSSSSRTSAARTPVQCTGSPTAACSSSTATWKPRCARRAAAQRPPGPAPTIVTSYIKNAALYARSELATAMLPSSTSRDPERQQHQPQIETETRVTDVQPVHPELVATRQIARRVHLRQAGQAGTNGV